MISAAALWPQLMRGQYIALWRTRRLDGDVLCTSFRDINKRAPSTEAVLYAKRLQMASTNIGNAQSDKQSSLSAFAGPLGHIFTQFGSHVQSLESVKNKPFWYYLRVTDQNAIFATNPSCPQKQT